MNESVTHSLSNMDPRDASASKNITRGVLHKEGESYTHVDGYISNVFIYFFVFLIFKSL